MENAGERLDTRHTTILTEQGREPQSLVRCAAALLVVLTTALSADGRVNLKRTTPTTASRWILIGCAGSVTTNGMD